MQEKEIQVKNSVTFVVKKEDRRFALEVPVGAPLGEVYVVLSEYMSKIVELINEHEKKRLENEAEKPEEKKEEE